MISPCQARGARAMLRFTVDELSERANVAHNTIVRVEAEKNVTTNTMDAIQRAFEASGIEFLSNDGLRLKRKP